MLIIEIDGEGHFTKEGIEHDRVRDHFLQNLGFKILRIPGYAVIREEGDVIGRIREFVGSMRADVRSDELRGAEPLTPTPLPFVPQGEGRRCEAFTARLDHPFEGARVTTVRCARCRSAASTALHPWSGYTSRFRSGVTYHCRR